MYKKIIYFSFIIFLISCSNEKQLQVKKNENIPNVDIIYKAGLKEYENGNYQKSIDILKKIEKNYSYTPFAPKALLMIAYIYYDSNNYLNSLETLKKFKEFYPANKNISYAEFLTAICLYEEINIASKDQTNSLLALKQFNKIIDRYPKTPYAMESKLKIDLIHEQLAAKEMYIARYYIKKEKWISAIIRLQIVIEKYQNTIFVDEALHRLVEINYKVGNIVAAKKYASILGYNFNNSDWYKKTYKIVGDKDYSGIKQENKKSLKDRLLSIFNFYKND